MKVIITRKLKKEICGENGSQTTRFISFRSLVPSEVLTARERGVKRFFIPELDSSASKVFFDEFDRFWGGVAASFTEQHAFWRNAASSKMQEWEQSFGYFLLALFALTRSYTQENIRLIIICNSLEMLVVCEAWARKHKWDFHVYGSRTFLPLIRFKQFLKNNALFLARAGFIFYKKIILFDSWKKHTADNDGKALLISLFYENSFKGNVYEDPFLGSLHHHLRSRNFHSVYLADSLDRPTRRLAKKISQSKDVIVCTPYSLLSWFAVIFAVFYLFTRRINFDACIFMKCDVSGLLYFYSRSFKESFNFTSELFYYSVLSLCKKNKFERMILAFEGNVHERACIQAFRTVCPDKVIVGYSHGVIYPLNLKLRLSPGEQLERPDPDIFIATGLYSKRLLETIGKRRGDRILSGCLLKQFFPEHDTDQKKSIGTSCITVSLDGMNSTVSFLDWFLEHSARLNNYRIVIRFHPNINSSRCLSQCIHTLPEHITVSERRLTEDIDASLCVVYRHSSVGIQSILRGIPSIYVGIDAPLQGDPIAGLCNFKWQARGLENLLFSISSIQNADSGELLKSCAAAQKNLHDFFSLPAPEALDSFLTDYERKQT